MTDDVQKHKAQSKGGKKSKRAISIDEQKRLQAARLVAREKKAKLIADAIKSWGPGKYKKTSGIVFAIRDGSIPLYIECILNDNPLVENATSKEFLDYYIEKNGLPDIGPAPDMSERRKMDRTPESGSLNES